jgi:integrin beta 3
MTDNLDPLFDAILRTFRSELSKVEQRIATLEKAPARDGRDGLPGRDGKDGEPGKDGRDGSDGLSFDDLSATFDGERTITLSAMRGERQKSWTWTIPVPLYRGVFQPETVYTTGDCVTFDGSVWVARTTPASKPGTAGSGWQLAVKRGQDGKR